MVWSSNFSARSIAPWLVVPVALVTVLVASACAAGSTSDSGAVIDFDSSVSIALVEPWPDLGELSTIAGSTFSFDDVAGEPTVVWFWGPG